jgi:O-antigen ligase
VNLKRGPWVGVVVGSATFCFFYARKLLAVIVVGAIVTSVAIPPIRERLGASYEHFTISGGRSTIWKIGLELAGKYPFGVGYHNSGILRDFSSEIPPELKHFHNNIINIAAEGGIITACIFVWLIVTLIRTCFARPLSVLHVAFGCALISWQTAGLVEYNVGDSEVTLIVWLLVGTLLNNLRQRGASENHLRDNS